jgi:hypothetical protein
MQDPQEQQQNAMLRLYGLFTAVFFAVVIALISFATLPGLQDPATGSLPEAGARALVILPVGFIVGAVLIFAITNRRSS